MLLAVASHGADEPTAVLVGWSQADITPPQTVALVGQNYLRIADPANALDPLTATAMAIESEDGQQAVLVSLDLVGAYDLGLHVAAVLEKRRPDDDRLAGLDTQRLILFATHTHTAPYLSNKAGIPEGTMDGDGYRAFLFEKLADLITEAWDIRTPGSLGTAKAQAAVGFNRIVKYADGSAKMYGDTTGPDFAGMEGPRDHTVELLYHWDADGKLKGVLVNVAAPSQVLEGSRQISADFWHETRLKLRAQPEMAEDLYVLAMCSAAGDQAPRDLEDQSLTEQHRRGQLGTRMIGDRLTAAILEAIPRAEKTKADRLVVKHTVRDFDVPRKPERGDEPFPVTLHCLRLGDAVIVDTPFELYLEFGLAIKQRSAAKQTFIAQLASGPAYGMYLPTENALLGQAYGSRAANGQVGPDGGQLIVEQTIEAIGHLFAAQ